jgi:hypothetical protein
MTRNVSRVRIDHVVNGANVRMVQRGDRPGFTRKPCARVRIVALRRGNSLDGDDSAKADVAGTVHFAHSAHTGQAEYFVRTESRS